VAIEELAMQKLRLLSSVSGELPYSAFFVVDEKLEYVLAGGEALVTTGYTPADFIGRSVREMVPPASADQAEADYRSVFASAPFVREHASMLLLLRLPGQAIEAWVDPVRLAQVLNNMLANSVKYTQVQGSIVAASDGPGAGSCFMVWLPLGLPQGALEA